MLVKGSQGLRIRYESAGEGPTVILHHGGGFRRESWDLAGRVQPLAAKHRVVTFDARGNGKSDKPTDPANCALELMVDDVLAVRTPAMPQRSTISASRWAPRSAGARRRAHRTAWPRSP